MPDGRDIGLGKAGLRARRGAELPVARMLAGQSVEDAAELMPRLFSLCRAAQSVAVRLAFGLEVADRAAEDTRREILRDHMMKMLVSWPRHFGLTTSAFPRGWADGDPALRPFLFGPAGAPPSGPDDLAGFLRTDTPVAAVLRRIADGFAPFEAATGILPAADAETAFRPGAIENSVAARQAAHPVMRHIEETRGRGPFWRAMARVFDTDDCLSGRLPPPQCAGRGRAIVTAARGLYAVSAEVADGKVAGFARITPTDHLLAPDGILDQSLASLPALKAGYAPLLLDILDPCTPVALEEAA